MARRATLGTDALLTFNPSVLEPVSLPLPPDAVPTSVSVELAQSVRPPLPCIAPVLRSRLAACPLARFCEHARAPCVGEDLFCSLTPGGVWRWTTQVELVEMEGTPISADGSCPRAARISAHLLHRDGRYSLVPIERGTASALQVRAD